MKTVTKATTNGHIPTRKRFEFIGFDEIDVNLVEPHPRNPRPSFHLRDDDPHLKAVGESIRVDGQHTPALVYEIHDDSRATGRYRLVQGERRWRACRIAGVPTLRCLILAPPQTEADEEDLLGSDTSFKEEWGQFFFLRWCRDVADKHGVPIASATTATKTGAGMASLKMADKVFKLEPALQAMVAEYEELMYTQRLDGQRQKRARLSGSGIRSREFPVSKAALVYDVFTALREHTPDIVRDYTNLELQRIIAAKATRGQTSNDDLARLQSQIRTAGLRAPVGLLGEIANLLEDERRTVKGFVRNTGVSEHIQLTRFLQSAPKMVKTCESITKNITQVGVDPTELATAHRHVMKLLLVATSLEKAFTERLEELEQG